MQSKTIVIDSRFNGPPNSANGGYTAGMLANLLGGDTQVLLHSPPPLNTKLELIVDGKAASLNYQNKAIATAQKTRVKLDVPICPPIDKIRSNEGRYINASEHLLPTCFVCGPERKSDDGLAIYPVRLNAYDCVASIWQPLENLAAADGLVANEIVWAALDCPGYFAHQKLDQIMLLGSIAASILRRPSPGETLISMGWQTAQDGRKHHSGTALYDQKGEICAISQQIWITLKTT